MKRLASPPVNVRTDIPQIDTVRQIKPFESEIGDIHFLREK